MSNLRIFKYNNYFNRIIKKHNSITDYYNDSTATYITPVDNCNFNPNDGITTEHIIGTTSSTYNGTGDYLIVCKVVDNAQVIQSRWFIIDHQRTKGGQWKLILKRDIIADYYNSIVTAPMIVNRAMISNENNPLLFNSEGFTFNQIKKSETLLQDKTKMPWYILYFKLNTPSMTVQFSTANISWDVDSSIDATSANSIWKSGTYYNTTDWQFKINYNPELFTVYTSGGLQYWSHVCQMNVPDDIIKHVDKYGTTGNFLKLNNVDYLQGADLLVNAFNDNVCENTLIPAANGQYYAGQTLKSDDAVAEYNKYNGQSFILRTIVQNVTNYYKVTVNVTKTKKTITIGSTSSLYATMKGIIDTAQISYNTMGAQSFECEYYENKIVVSTEAYTPAGSYNASLALQSYASCTDAPYYIMAVPMYEFDVQKADSTHCHSYQLDSEMFVNAVIKAAGESNLLDVQILPYFPYISKIKQTYLYDAGGYMELQIFDQYTGQTPEFVDYLNSRQYHSFYRTGDENIGINAFFIDTANFTFDINQTVSIPSRVANRALNKKLSNELDKFRLCSPNYNGMFEFSAAKNDAVSYFNVDCTLKPYTPYIHVNPAFDSLYGKDFNDARGLICQGDFSIPIVSDLWKQYEYQNKNYLNTFNRQIEHMDFTHGQEQTMAKWNIGLGAITGAAAGALAGSRIGGGIGTAVGAGVGAAASIAGGIVDYNLLKERQFEDKDFAVDNFKYQLGNIQALPYNINKVTCLTFNNKLWPFIEYYSATDEEANILNNKILYNSMTVNAIGTISEYQQSERTFISGDLIRLEGTDLTGNEVNEIYKEIKKGVYI